MAPNTVAVQELPHLPLFNIETTQLPDSERAKLAYQRAAAIVQAYSESSISFNVWPILINMDSIDFSRDDVKNLTANYWKFHTDPILTIDTAATTLITLQLNLCAGTILHFAGDDRQDLLSIVDDLLVYKLQ